MFDTSFPYIAKRRSDIHEYRSGVSDDEDESTDDLDGSHGCRDTLAGEVVCHHRR